MQEIILALIAGAGVGALFSMLQLPLPAPPVLSGIIGIVGVYLGGEGYKLIMQWLFT